MNTKQKRMLYRIIISSILFSVLFFAEHMGTLNKFPQSLQFCFYMITYLVIGYDIVWGAFKNIIRGKVFDEQFLMMIATFGAFGIAEYSEAVVVMLFYQIGEFFQSYAVGKSRKSITDMMNICPTYVNLEQDGKLLQVDPEEVTVDSIITIKPGERIPLDGVVTEGESFIDTKAINGESVPRRVSIGDPIISGCLNGSNLLRVKVTKVFEDSTVSKVLQLVEEAGNRKAPVENYITKFAKFYTPIVTITAVLLALIPPLLFAGIWSEWIKRACIFLVISCPCALVISVPLGFFGGIGAASKIGVLVKGSNFLEAVAHMTTIVFDKTGTLTKGEFRVVGLEPNEVTKDRLLETAALAESYSTHPIALSIRQAYDKEPDLTRVDKAEEIPGQGVRVLLDGKCVFLGNEKLLQEQNIEYTASDKSGTIIYVAEEGRFLGAIRIDDVVKENVAETLADMRKAGVKKTVMLTGDRQKAADNIAGTIGIDEVYAQLLPQDKVSKVEALLKEQKKGQTLAFVGDGINDAPVLMRADIGIAMGSLGSDAAIEAADVVLIDDNVRKIGSLIRIARKTLQIVKQNIVFSLAVKLLVLILGACGYATMWEAVFADVGVSVIAILNSVRTLRLTK